MSYIKELWFEAQQKQCYVIINVGDDVYCTPQGSYGKVLKVYPPDNMYSSESYLIELPAGAKIMLNEKDVLPVALADTAEAPKQLACECGAKFTGFPNHHFDWCPLHHTSIWSK